MRTEVCPNQTHRIWIAGDVADARRACRNFTLSGLCVSIHKTDFIYTMGAEHGVCVTLINYPRFPTDRANIESIAKRLGHHLCKEMFQGSFTIEGPEKMQWFSRREQDHTPPKGTQMQNIAPKTIGDLERQLNITQCIFTEAFAEAQAAMEKYPQPNYVISKVAEEAGEVVKAAIHCAEGRETKEAVRAEVKQAMAMLIRLYLEGDQVHGLEPLSHS